MSLGEGRAFLGLVVVFRFHLSFSFFVYCRHMAVPTINVGGVGVTSTQHHKAKHKQNGPMPRILLQERGLLGCIAVWVRTCSGMHPSTVYRTMRPPVGGIEMLVCDRAPGLIV